MDLKPHLDAAFATVRAWYAYPLLRHQPELSDVPIPGLDTAVFDLASHRCLISRSFAHSLLHQGNLTPADLFLGVLTHELGHYIVFPRELSVLLYLCRAAERYWPHAQAPARHGLIVNSYCDVVNNLDALLDDRRGPALSALYRALAALNPHPLNQLLLGLCGELSGTPLIGQLPEPQQHRVACLTGIDYLCAAPAAHAANLLTFGEAIEDLLPPAEDGDAPLDRYSVRQLNDALDDILRRHGKTVFEETRDYLQRTRPRFVDPYAAPSQPPGRGAGTAGSRRLAWNHEQISYYRRQAASYGLYVATKPIREASEDLYPSEQVTFEVGDELQRLNPWSSPRIIPGLTQRWEQAAGRRVQWRHRVPDLLVVLDSSASMPHPRDHSAAVLAAFVLGRNYYANGARIGLVNFSADLLCVAPSRDREAFWEATCAYWGGGTVLNVERLQAWLATLRDEAVPDPQTTDEADYRQLLERLDQDADDFAEKQLSVQLPARVPKPVCERLDMVLVTDGAIANLRDVIRCLGALGREARTFVFVINNPGDVARWRRLDLPKTEVYSVARDQDLLGLSLGRARAMARHCAVGCGAADV